MYAALMGQTLISAGTYLAGKRAMEEMPPFEVVISRFLLSGGVFILLLLVLPGRRLPPSQALPRILFLGLMAGPINQGFFFYGLSRSLAAHAALLYALTPLGVYLYLLARKRESVSRAKFVGIFVALSGVIVLLLGRGLKAAWGPLLGDLFILVAVASWVLYTAEGRTLIASHGAVRSTAWTMVTGALLSLPVAPFVFSAAHVASVSVTAKFMLLYLGVLTSVVAYIFWYFALSRLEASKVAVFANLQPPATALAAWFILGEPLTWEIIVGGVLVVVGVRIAQRA